MTDRLQFNARWTQYVGATLVTIGFAVIVVWTARSWGRTLVFAFGVNWILSTWAILLGRVLQSRSGAWDGVSILLPSGYYVTRPFEMGGRFYDYLGVRWYRRLMRPCLWSVNPALLRSQPGARQTMIQSTQNPEAGHLLIFIVIMGITLWALASGWWSTVAWLLLFNLLHNGYPMLSMRQVRARLLSGLASRKSETMNIRHFEVGDEAALWQVFFSAIHKTASADYTPEQINAWAPAEVDLARWANRMRSISPFVAEQNGKIVGYADIQSNGYIDHFFVSPAVDRQGVGSSLMRRIHDAAIAQGTESLYADVSVTARPFFEKWGFEVETTQAVTIRGVTLRNYRMRKSRLSGI